MSWRLANSLIQLRVEINAKWPFRDKTSDGTIGDAAHATRDSDHNPWLNDTVRAMDIDVDGIDAAWYAEHLRLLGAAGDRRLRKGGYVIFNGRITAPDFSHWNVYTGSNKHTHHVHVSVSTDGYDDSGSWGISTAPVTSTGTATPPPPPAGHTPITRFAYPAQLRGKYIGPRSGPNESISGMAKNGSDRWAQPFIRNLQTVLIGKGYARFFPRYGADGMYGETVNGSELGQAIKQLQRDKGITVDGLCGQQTWDKVYNW